MTSLIAPGWIPPDIAADVREASTPYPQFRVIDHETARLQEFNAPTNDASHAVKHGSASLVRDGQCPKSAPLSCGDAHVAKANAGTSGRAAGNNFFERDFVKLIPFLQDILPALTQLAALTSTTLDDTVCEFVRLVITNEAVAKWLQALIDGGQATPAAMAGQCTVDCPEEVMSAFAERKIDWKTVLPKVLKIIALFA